MSLLVASASAAPAPASQDLSLRNARAVWKDGRAHIVIDCADRAEYAGREECGFGAICCAVLPEGLDTAVVVRQGGPFVTSVARNAIRIDGAFDAGDYDVRVQPPLRTRRGTTLGEPFTAHVQIPPPLPSVAPRVEAGPPLLVSNDSVLPPDATNAGSQLTQVQFGPPAEGAPWSLVFALPAAPPAHAVDVRMECFAKLVGDARDKAACTSFHFESLFGWTPIGTASASLDAHGRATLACPPVIGTPLVAGDKVLVAVAEAHEAQSGALVGRAVAQTAVRPAGPAMRLSVTSAHEECPLQIDVAVAIDGPVKPCAQVDLKVDAVWTEWAWDYGGGRERSVVQPWRTQLHASSNVLSSVAGNPHRTQVRTQINTAAPHVLLRARCGDGEAARVIANPCSASALSGR